MFIVHSTGTLGDLSCTEAQHGLLPIQSGHAQGIVGRRNLNLSARNVAKSGKSF